jgi:hypothetical protein
MEEMMLGVPEVARLLGRHPQSVRRYEARGLLPKAARDPLTNARLWRLEDVQEAARRNLAPIPPEHQAMDETREEVLSPEEIATQEPVPA